MDEVQCQVSFELSKCCRDEEDIPQALCYVDKVQERFDKSDGGSGDDDDDDDDDTDDGGDDIDGDDDDFTHDGCQFVKWLLTWWTLQALEKDKGKYGELLKMFKHRLVLFNSDEDFDKAEDKAAQLLEHVSARMTDWFSELKNEMVVNFNC